MSIDTTLAANPLGEGLDQLPPPSSVLVIFGATGDLARRKLLPALYNLAHDGALPERFALIGVARSELDDAGYKDDVREAIERFSRRPADPTVLAAFLENVGYVAGGFEEDDAYVALAPRLDALDVDAGQALNRAFYLSTAPRFFGPIVEQLGAHGLSDKSDSDVRVVIEKPFGTTKAEALELNRRVRDVLREEQIFRIDHYLGKETVQNLLTLRFANQMYEPLWNANYVDHVQITMAEDIGVGGRAGYYDGIGAARDVIQNHLLQLLALTAMEEPVTFAAKDLRAEKEKILSAVRLPADLATGTARGQYSGGWQGGEKVHGFLYEDGMDPQSTTETFAAIKLEIATRRWAGVPFYLRAGKRLGRRVTEIAVVFKQVGENIFGTADQLGQNALVIRVQPDEGVTLRFGSKVPGVGTQVRDVTMDFGYGHAFTEASPEAYERLILDVLLGDPPLFPRHEEVELSWKILDPIE